jgi:hypothetical protein
LTLAAGKRVPWRPRVGDPDSYPLTGLTCRIQAASGDAIVGMEPDCSAGWVDASSLDPGSYVFGWEVFDGRDRARAELSVSVTPKQASTTPEDSAGDR